MSLLLFVVLGQHCENSSGVTEIRCNKCGKVIHTSEQVCSRFLCIEETSMQHAKSQAGSGRRDADISGLLINYEAYCRWALTAHKRSRYVEVMLQMENISDDGSGRKHRDTRPSQVKEK